MRPLAALYGALLRWDRWRTAQGEGPTATPVPVVVIGNLIVGGAGKTPVVIALAQALRARGWQPGVVSRGYGRRADGSLPVRAVSGHSTAAEVGDEPLLIWRRTGVPVWVGRDRAAVVRALCAANPSVDVVLADDGLQHRPLARVAEVLVFDERGAGNGLLLPAGPLREPLPAALAARQRVVFAGATPPPLQPATPLQRRPGMAWPLDAWWSGDASACQPLAALQGRPLLAVAGLGEPEKFFRMLEAEGLAITRAPQPDHAPYASLPWPAGTADVVLTEKDAVKLPPARVSGTRVWVLPLDLDVPAGWLDDLIGLLPPRPPTSAPRAGGPAKAEERSDGHTNESLMHEPRPPLD